MDTLVALPVALPLVMAALFAAASSIAPRRLVDVLALLTTAAVLGVCLALTFASRDSAIVSWFGGWTPRGHVALGIGFEVEPLGAGLASFVALLVLAAFTFAWSSFKTVKALFHALMLVFLAGMAGFCLTGDLFNLFVWFELMNAAAVALCGYKSEELISLEGAFNFAVVNTVGAFLSLTGISLVYARTGALNMAQAAATLAHGPDELVLVAFMCIALGFLVKAAVVPFHFWLPDAHAVAPTPVSVLFSGVMVELGVFGAARVYWSVFAGALEAQRPVLRAVFVGLGVASALVGGVMCLGQRHLKRLLAFSTISHVGLVVCAFGLLDAGALSGGALYVLGHGLVKGALFTVAGVLLHRFGSVDQGELHGRAGEHARTGLLLVVGALALSGLPPFVGFFGEARLLEAARVAGLGWLSWVSLAAGVLTGGAILRYGASVFWGFGPALEEECAQGPKLVENRETITPGTQVPASLIGPAVMLLTLALAVGLVPGLRPGVDRAAARFVDEPSRLAHVLDGVPEPTPPVVFGEADASDVAHGLLSTLGALALALAVLFPRAVPRSLARTGRFLAQHLLEPLRSLHTGRVGDYVTWFVLGVGVCTGLVVWLK